MIEVNQNRLNDRVAVPESYYSTDGQVIRPYQKIVGLRNDIVMTFISASRLVMDPSAAPKILRKPSWNCRNNYAQLDAKLTQYTTELQYTQWWKYLQGKFSKSR